MVLTKDLFNDRTQLDTLRSIIENTQDMMFIKNADYVYISVSKPFVEMAGYSTADEVVGRTDFELFKDTEFAKRYRDDDERLISSGAPYVAYVEPIPAPDGTTRYASTYKYPLRDEDGKTIGIIGFSHDITWTYRAKMYYGLAMSEPFAFDDDTLRVMLIDVDDWRICDYRVRDEKGELVQKYFTIQELISRAVNVILEDEAKAFYTSLTAEALREKYHENICSLSCDYTFTRSDGTKAKVSEQISLMPDPVNSKLSAVCVLRCQRGGEQQQKADMELQDLLAMFDSNTPIGIIGISQRGERYPVKHINDNLLSYFGLTKTAFLNEYGADFLRLLAPEHAPDIARRLREASKHDKREAFTACCRRAGQPDVWMSFHFRRVPQIGDKHFLLGVATDVTEMRTRQHDAEVLADNLSRQRDELYLSARHDTLTGLLNREGTMQAIHEYLSGEGESGRHALFMLDIDNFKQVNDTFGHQSGDDALSKIAVLISKCFRKCDIVGRIGGDEFFAFMKNIRSIASVKKKAEDLLSSLGFVYAVDGIEVELSASIGISLYDNARKNLSSMYAEADSALYRTKAMGKACYNFAEEDTSDTDDNLPPDSPSSFNIRNVLDNLNRGIELVHQYPDLRMVPVFCNERLLSILGGISREEYHALCGNDLQCSIHPDDVELLRLAMHTSLKTKKPVSCNYRKLGAKGRFYWVHLDANLVKYPGGAADMYAVISDATEIVREQNEQRDRYEAFLQGQSREANSMLAMWHINLTQNAVKGVMTDIAQLKELKIDGTASDFFTALAAFSTRVTDSAVLSEKLNRDSLLQYWATGVWHASTNHTLRVHRGRPIYVQSSAELARNPDTGDVEAVLYIKDVDRSTNFALLTQKLVQDDFDFLGLIDAETGELSVYGGEDYASPLTHEINGMHFDRVTHEYMSRRIRTDNLEQFFNAVAWSHVLDVLEKLPRYLCHFAGADGDSENDRFVSLSFMYLDTSRTTVLVSRKSITQPISGERDWLTDMLNREGFMRVMRDILRDRPTVQYMLYRFDIDNFKLINDTFGSTVGDRILRDIAIRLRVEDFADSAVMGRLHSDHFAVFVPADRLNAQTLYATLHTLCRDNAIQLKPSIHLGAYLISDNSAEPEVLCDRALIALKSVKDSAQNHIGYFDDKLREKLIEEQLMTSHMRDALAKGEFEVYFQPQINYDTKCLVGAEALVRWRHPEKGLLMPNAFIPLFERNGFIVELDNYVQTKCCEYLARWRGLYSKGCTISVSVNLSGIDLYRPNIVDELLEITTRHGVLPSELRLEISEQSYIQNPEYMLNVAKELKAAGFGLELDDFGRGYTSLRTLRDLPVDLVKVDMNFIADEETRTRSCNILASLIHMAHWLKLPLMAEGVETQAQAEYLKSLNCCYMQGYYFDKPMSADAFEELLRSEAVGNTDRYSHVTLQGMSAFWNPATQTSLLFNTFVGGAAVVEYHRDTLYVLRANDRFYTERGTTRARHVEGGQNLLIEVDAEDKKRLLAALGTAIHGKGESTCTTRLLPTAECEDGVTVSVKLKLLSSNEDRYLLYMAVENVTAK